jgi:hypothetical protein
MRSALGSSLTTCACGMRQPMCTILLLTLWLWKGTRSSARGTGIYLARVQIKWDPAGQHCGKYRPIHDFWQSRPGEIRAGCESLGSLRGPDTEPQAARPPKRFFACSLPFLTSSLSSSTALKYEWLILGTAPSKEKHSISPLVRQLCVMNRFYPSPPKRVYVWPFCTWMLYVCPIAWKHTLVHVISLNYNLKVNALKEKENWKMDTILWKKFVIPLNSWNEPLWDGTESWARRYTFITPTHANFARCHIMYKISQANNGTTI